VNDRPPRRKQSWMRSQSDGFRPIKQVGVAVSIGFPLLAMGVLLLSGALSDGTTFLWVLAGVLLGVGLIAAISGRIT
jgi:hypothetical protein